jgi:predicted membrane protein
MRRIIMAGGSNRGSFSLRNKFILASFIVLGVILMAFFAFAAIAVAVVLVPVGIILVLARKIFLSGKNAEKTTDVKAANTGKAKDIIDVTDYKQVEEFKAVCGEEKDEV